MSDEAHWQYGIRFGDGSEAWRWSGRTSRIRAEAELIHLRRAYTDPFKLVRRAVDERGRPVAQSQMVEDDADAHP